MRESLLEILKCPKCNNLALSVHKEEESSLEIKKGQVICKKCLASYKINEGIVDFLKTPPEEVIKEIKAMDDDACIIDEKGNKYKVTEKTIETFREKFLILPQGDNSDFFKSGGCFQNIKENSHRLFSTLADLHLTGNEKILEIGACFSYASYHFAKKGCEVVAIDISNYLKVGTLLAEKTYFDRVFCDMHQLPFKTDAFDVIFGSAVLHHSKDLRKIFGELKRVLKPKKGRLVLINESAKGVFEKIPDFYKDLKERGFGDVAYSIPQWYISAKTGGFNRVKLQLLSIVDDYIARHQNRKSKTTTKLKIAHFLQKNKILEEVLLFILTFPRILFRPRSWKLICYKEK